MGYLGYLGEYADPMDIPVWRKENVLEPDALEPDALEPVKASGSSGYEAPACITCGDHAVELEISELNVGADPCMAVGRAGDGGTEVIDVSLVQPIRLGDRVMAHARMAITRLS